MKGFFYLDLKFRGRRVCLQIIGSKSSANRTKIINARKTPRLRDGGFQNSKFPEFQMFQAKITIYAQHFMPVVWL